MGRIILGKLMGDGSTIGSGKGFEISSGFVFLIISVLVSMSILTMIAIFCVDDPERSTSNSKEEDRTSGGGKVFGNGGLGKAAETSGSVVTVAVSARKLHKSARALQPRWKREREA
ncbi:hypothetical protein H6P81_008770 [Aristolochia fimbriata]|uniref:Uncharacterized protein n=1 Tax=Aristolochia fimbriata TaxID=158543 RepID=A0AAV7EIZ0_ARIFI|nr:hypothetical protein H6P81_008770 [Aristolochia fimbriata]